MVSKGREGVQGRIQAFKDSCCWAVPSPNSPRLAPHCRTCGVRQQAQLFGGDAERLGQLDQVGVHRLCGWWGWVGGSGVRRGSNGANRSPLAHAASARAPLFPSGATAVQAQNPTLPSLPRPQCPPALIHACPHLAVRLQQLHNGGCQARHLAREERKGVAVGGQPPRAPHPDGTARGGWAGGVVGRR